MDKKRRLKRHKRIRAKIFGTSERPRLSIFRSNQHIYTQIIDDTKGNTIAFANSLEFKNEKMNNKEKVVKVAENLVKRAKEKGIDKVVFDRGGFAYKGRIKVLAEKLKEFGLKF